ncbi:MAG: 50S ribosomal protein L24 [Clostridia bacterium]|nr:50S ribosomal protein L24 [Clostridia bacterium]
MAKMNVKTGDNVLIISGSREDKGKISVVSATSPKTNKVCVEGVNIQTKHQKARRANEKSEIIKKEGFIDASNVMVVCPTCNKATRVARKIEDGKSVRVCKKCGAVLDTEKKVAKKATKGTASAKKAKESKKSSAKKADEKSEK